VEITVEIKNGGNRGKTSFPTMVEAGKKITLMVSGIVMNVSTF